MNTKVVIVGAGIAGLTLGYKLAERGIDVLVLEKEQRVGGLARSFSYGNYTFDIGPHRFFSSAPEIKNFINKILCQNAYSIQRNCSIYLKGKYYSWPLRPSELLRLPANIIFRCGVDLFRKPSYCENNPMDLKSHTVNQFGPTLYEHFFKDYNKKFTGLSCSNLHYSWLAQSLGKALIDKKKIFTSLRDMLQVRNIFDNNTMRFIYPKGGVRVFSEVMSEFINKKGGRVVTSVKDLRVDFNKSKVADIIFNGRRESLDWLIWTAPIPQIAAHLGLNVPKLSYIDLLIYNIETKRPIDFSQQWIYFGEKDFVFSRISIPANFCKDNVPPGKGSLCVEIPSLNESMWLNPESMIEGIVNNLEKAKICARENISTIHVEKISNAYPLYELDYLEKLKDTNKELLKFANVKCLGRTGSFTYNNMDDSIAAAFKTSRELLGTD